MLTSKCLQIFFFILGNATKLYDVFTLNFMFFFSLYISFKQKRIQTKRKSNHPIDGDKCGLLYSNRAFYIKCIFFFLIQLSSIENNFIRSIVKH